MLIRCPMHHDTSSPSPERYPAHRNSQGIYRKPRALPICVPPHGFNSKNTFNHFGIIADLRLCFKQMRQKSGRSQRKRNNWALLKTHPENSFSPSYLHFAAALIRVFLSLYLSKPPQGNNWFPICMDSFLFPDPVQTVFAIGNTADTVAYHVVFHCIHVCLADLWCYLTAFSLHIFTVLI